jgi:putative ABC transport system permease protein
MILGSILTDIRYGVRALIRRPLITLVAIATIAVGTGSSTAIFTAVDAILLRPLPFADPDRLTAIWTHSTERDKARRYVSYPDFADWRKGSHTFEEMGAWYPRGVALNGDREPVHVNAAVVTPSLFSVLRTSPKLGRVFEDADGKDQNGLVLSHRAWELWFGSDPQVLGRNVLLSGEGFTVIGVMPPSFQFPIQAEPVDMWLRLNAEEGGMYKRRGARILYAVGRMKPGVSVSQAQSDMSAMANALKESFPATNATIGIDVNPLSEELVGNVRTSLIILFGAVCLVLLIACVTVANLMVAEGLARGREMAVRTALGATRTRIVRQLLTEYLIIAILGGVAGGLVGFWACQAFAALSPVSLPHLDGLRLDGRVMAFTLAVTTLTGLLFGLTPAVQLSAVEPADALRDRSAGAGRGAGRWTQRAMIVSQIAITQVLLIGAGLLIHSFWRQQMVNTGLDPRNVLSLRLALPATYDAEGCVNFFNRLQQRLKVLPGVEAASAVMGLPFSGQESVNLDFEVEGHPAPESSKPAAEMRLVQPDYFRTMGVPLVDGRDFTERDNAEAPSVVIVNQTLARRYFEDGSPVGKIIKQGDATFSVVGVVGDIKNRGTQHDAQPELFLPLAQSPMDDMYVVLKSKVDGGSQIQSVRAAIKELDKDLPAFDVRPLDERLSETFARQRFSMSLLIVFAGVALFLTIIGLHGVLAQAVAQQRREIATRMAVGASPAVILRGVVGHGMLLTIVGLVIGTVFSVIITRFMESLLFGVTATDPLTYLALATLLALVALITCYVPARRAARIDPIMVLRSE